MTKLTEELKQEILQWLDQKNTELGFSFSAPLIVQSLHSYSDAINSEDTWTGPLADREAGFVAECIKNMANTFTEFRDEVAAAPVSDA